MVRTYPPLKKRRPVPATGGVIFVPLAILLALSGCRTTYQGVVTEPSPFAFSLTPEQCQQLSRERRTYDAAGDASLYVSGAGALVSALALALTDTKTAPAVSSGLSLLAGGVGAFSESQVGGLDQELAAGGCPR
jgi:hypothetical protein